MRVRMLMLALGACALCVSCGNKTAKRLDALEYESAESRAGIKEADYRLGAVEGQVDKLASDVRALSTGVYEVRTRTGKKTGMVAVPVRGEAKSAAVVPAGRPVPRPAAPVPAADVSPTPMSHAAPQQQSSDALPQPKRFSPMPSLDMLGELAVGEADSVPQAAPASAAPVVAKPTPSHAPRMPAPSALALPPENAPAVAAATPALPPESGLPAMKTIPPVRTTGASAMPASVPTVGGEEAAYKAALALVTSGRFSESVVKFNEFLAAYPSGRYAPNAYYWIGESLYSQRSYPEALMQFKEVATRFPRHHKSADALLKAGMAYQRMGDKENAELQFKALLADFPRSEAARLARNKGWGR